MNTTVNFITDPNRNEYPAENRNLNWGDLVLHVTAPYTTYIGGYTEEARFEIRFKGGIYTVVVYTTQRQDYGLSADFWDEVYFKSECSTFEEAEGTLHFNFETVLGNVRDYGKSVQENGYFWYA